MFFSIRRCVATLILLPLGAVAQPAPNPADPDAAGSGAIYTSAFGGYLGARDDKASPDQVWRSANRDVMAQQDQGAHIHGSGAHGPTSQPPVTGGPGREAANVQTAPPAAAERHGNHAHGAH